MKSPRSTWPSRPSRRRRSFCPSAPPSIAPSCWFAKMDFPEVTRVRYHVQYSQFAAYRSLAENCLYNGTLPLGQRCEAAQD